MLASWCRRPTPSSIPLFITCLFISPLCYVQLQESRCCGFEGDGDCEWKDGCYFCFVLMLYYCYKCVILMLVLLFFYFITVINVLFWCLFCFVLMLYYYYKRVILVLFWSRFWRDEWIGRMEERKEWMKGVWNERERRMNGWRG